MITETKIEDYERLSKYLDGLMEKPKLRNIFLELTDKCNLNCAHCGSGCTKSNSNFLDTGTAIKMLEDVAKRYDPMDIRICITGGEPLLHSDVLHIIEKAHGLGFSTGMTTNGTLIDDRLARCLAASGLDTIAISIDGLPSQHDIFRCSEGSFRKAVSGIKALRKYGMSAQVTTVVNKGNIGSLESIYLMLKDLGIESWVLVNVDPIGRAKGRSMLLNAEELNKMYSFVRDKRFDESVELEVLTACSHFQGMEFERETRDHYFQCWAGTRIAGIRANGDIVACLDIEKRPELTQGNIYKDDFIFVWENKYGQFRKNRALESEMCKKCKYAKMCRGDSAHTWDYDKNEPNYCIMKLKEENLHA